MKSPVSSRKRAFITIILTTFSLLVIPVSLFAFPTVYPYGTTIYQPDKCFNGYTVLAPPSGGTVVIDMNGNVVQWWPNVSGRSGPAKLLPGGYVMGATGAAGTIFGQAESNDLSVVDWDGNIIWSFPKAGVHDDFQREPNPVGYFVPGMDPYVNKGKTLILSNKIVEVVPPYNDYIDYISVTDYAGNIIFDWLLSNHLSSFDYIHDDVCWDVEFALETTTDPLDIHSASWLGPNKWYDAGDDRFHPDNIIVSGNLARIIAIIDHQTGAVSWISPTIDGVGLDAHMITKGLPGEGNVLAVQTVRGCGTYELKGYSSVVEINPITGRIVWEYNALKAGKADASTFYQMYAGGAQRLPNGNTLITEGDSGRIFEVTPDHKIVWEYVSPFCDGNSNLIYKASRVPYDYIPQAGDPVSGPERTCPYSSTDDADDDGIYDSVDNCPLIANWNQADNDEDGRGDVCDEDDDNDTVLDENDNCPYHANTDQLDTDGDGTGDVCDFDDTDNDGVLDEVDNCPGTALGEVVNDTGCSIADLCPCENEWKNHGRYVSCVENMSEEFVAIGLITETARDIIVSDAKQSDCGSKK